MVRWNALWLAWVGALSAQGSEGSAYDLDPALTCPSPSQLRSTLDAQVPALSSSNALDQRTLRVRAGPMHTLVVELLDPLSRVSFSRSIPKGSCEAQAKAVALLVLSWIDKGASPPEAEIARVVVIPKVSPSSPGPSPAPSTGWRVSWESRLSGGGSLASTPSPLGASFEGSFQAYLSRHWGVALRAAWFTPLRAGDPESAGSVELHRYAVGLDASWTGRPLPAAMDVAFGVQDEIDQTEPAGYPQDNGAVSHTPQFRVAVRYRWRLVAQLFAYAEGSATVGPWPHRFLADDPQGEVQLLALPAVQVAIDLGLGWHFL